MAKRKVGQAATIIYRAVKFEVRPEGEALAAIFSTSDVLRRIYNWAVLVCQSVYDSQIDPVYEKLKAGITTKAELRMAWRLYPSLFGLINCLTYDEEVGTITRNFAEETLDDLMGGKKSFASLRKKGDPDARPPKLRDPNFFRKIPGRSGFRVKGGQFLLNTGMGRFTFPIPEYQQGRLARAKQIRKFELYRTPQDLRKPGIFEVSIVYEIERPAPVRFEPSEAIFVALGASHMGVITPTEELLVKLWRPDRHWMLPIREVERRMKKCERGSNQWRRLNDARRTMQIKMARQQLQDQREIASWLVSHGRHFVVTDLVVRSKEGKLADSEVPERGGLLGFNWSAQNTGAIGRVALQLEGKAAEVGGSVRKVKLSLDEAPPMLETEGKLHSDKIWMARKLREQYLESLAVGVVG